MKKYTYQILRYIPDQVTGEFVNVGLVLFCDETNYLNAQMLEKSTRIKAVFPSVNSKSFTARLKTFAKVIQNIGADQDKVEEITNIEQITNGVIAPDDSALQFGKVEMGIDINLQNTF